MRKEADGSFTGMKTSMFDYSGKWLVAFERYDELLDEFALKWDKKHKKKKLIAMFPLSDPTSAVKRDIFLRALVDKGHCHIQKFVDHLITEGNRIFSGTETADTWSIYSDGLVQYWTPRNMAYLDSIGFGNRLWRAEGETNITNRYNLKVPGNSPEINVGTDNDCFKDFGLGIAQHIALSFLYGNDYKLKFSLATIPMIASTMSR